MGHTVSDWTHSLVLQMPRGLLWSYEADSQLYRYVQGYAPRLAAVEVSADSLQLEMRPESTNQLLPDYEQYLGLPECQVDNQGFESRRAAVVEKYHRKGGLQTWNIEKLAADLGFTVAVEENFPHHCLRSCVYPLWEEKYRHMLRVTIYGIPAAYMTCMDNVLTHLVSSDARILECTLNRYKAAGKYYEFYYDETDYWDIAQRAYKCCLLGF